MKTLSNLNRYLSIILILITAVFLTGCGKEEETPKVKVNDKVLTSEELHKLLSQPKFKNYNENELIKEWIDNEVLYKEAVQSGLLKDSSFLAILEESQKRITAEYWLSVALAKHNMEISEEEVAEYYNKNKNSFTATSDYYKINVIAFNSEIAAIDFRNEAFQNGWKSGLKVVADSTIHKKLDDAVLLEWEIYPVILQKYIAESQKNALSLIIAKDNYFYVFELLDKFDKGTILPFVKCKNEIKNILTANKKEEFKMDYIKGLYLKNNIEIKGDQ